MPPERVLIRADVGDRIGHGHLARCATLGRELVRRGSQVVLVVGERDGVERALASRKGLLHDVDVVRIPVPVGADAEPAAGHPWGVDEQRQDATASMKAAFSAPPDAVVVDHYRLDATWETTFRARQVRVLVIDDLADRAHDADVLVDMGLRRDAEHDYAGLVTRDAVRLFGPRYAIIDPDYATMPSGARPAERARTVVAFGGSGSSAATLKVLSATSGMDLWGLHLDVVLPRALEQNDELALRLAARTDITIHDSPDGMVEILRGADLAIGAGGVSTWERFAAGVPTILLTTAANQVQGAARLAAEELVVDLGSAEAVNPDDLRAAIRSLLEDGSRRERMVTKARSLVDGRGVHRVAVALLPRLTGTVRLRPAGPSDELDVLGLANDPEVRRQSFTGHAISLEEHRDWFRRQLEDPARWLFVLEAGDLVVGQVRFAPTSGGLEVSYSLNAAVRGRGLAAEMIREGCRLVREFGGEDRIVARTRPTNEGSRRALQRAGFRLLEDDDPEKVTYWHDAEAALHRRRAEA